MNQQFLTSPVRVPGRAEAPALHLLGGPRVVHQGRWLDVPEGASGCSRSSHCTAAGSNAAMPRGRCGRPVTT